MDNDIVVSKESSEHFFFFFFNYQLHIVRAYQNFRVYWILQVHEIFSKPIYNNLCYLDELSWGQFHRSLSHCLIWRRDFYVEEYLNWLRKRMWEYPNCQRTGYVKEYQILLRGRAEDIPCGYGEEIYVTCERMVKQDYNIDLNIM